MLIIGSASLWYAIQVNDFLWVSRSGSVITVLGIMLTIKHSIFSNARDLQSVVREKNHYAVFAPDQSSDMYREHEAHAKIVIRDEYLGASLTIFGTIIWGYGDLLGKIFT